MKTAREFVDKIIGGYGDSGLGPFRYNAVVEAIEARDAEIRAEEREKVEKIRVALKDLIDIAEVYRDAAMGGNIRDAVIEQANR